MDYELRFDAASFERLDRFALLARQDYNLGDWGDWFGCFRRGLFGLYARLYGVALHYSEVHSWRPWIRPPTEIEYHLSSIMFNMDSAVECGVFMLNALGNAVAPTEFKDVADVSALSGIAPWNIVGSQRRQPLPGYGRLFPEVQAWWNERRKLIEEIAEQHDVSKHRSMIYVGGQHRVDPPEGFYERLGILDDPSARALYRPMAEIILQVDPKTPQGSREPRPRSEMRLLETLVGEFREFVDTTAARALEDAQATIPLREYEFRESMGKSATDTRDSEK